ncbi:MAG: MucR family transcriptional regulator [Hyphomonadaceae bacterium]
MTSEIVASFVSNNPATTENLPDVIGSLYRTVASLPDAEEAKPGEKLRPAVPVGKSITDDYLVFCETGRRLKMLSCYVRSSYNMSPDDCRRRWSLQADYPMVAPCRTGRRSAFARKIGPGKGVRKTR